MNILAIDYGEKRIGLARADTELQVPLPFGVIDTKEWRTHLSKIIQEEKIGRVIVGLPLGLNGSIQPNTKRVQEFIIELGRIISTPIEPADERFTSQAADRMGTEGASRDEKAAMVLLSDYLQKQ